MGMVGLGLVVTGIRPEDFIGRLTIETKLRSRDVR